MKTTYFEDCTNVDEVKSKYKKLAFLFHPDRGGDTATMQEINAQYKFICINKVFTEESEKNNYADSEKFADILQNLLFIKDIEIEVCGNWLWITGNTYFWKKEIKAQDFKFSKNKMAWYWHPEGYRKRGKKHFNIEQIRNLWGSEKIGTESKLLLTS